MSAADHPALTVVLVTPDHFRSVRQTVSHLRAQTAREQMELVIVAPADVVIDLSDPSVAAAVAGIGMVRVPAVPSISPGGAARAAGIKYGASLDALLDAETVLQWELRRLGHELYLEPAAAAAHVNFALWRSWLPVQLVTGRLFAATRGNRWSLRRRLAFAAASPLIPLVRFQRAFRQAVRAGVPWTVIAGTVPVIAIGVAVDGIGLLLGYALGPGDSAVRSAEFEHHRERHVTVSDRMALARPSARRTTRAAR